MQRPGKGGLWAVGFTGLLVLLVAVAASGDAGPFVLTLPAGVVLGVAAIWLLFPGNRFFGLALSNFLAVYACIFYAFAGSNFARVDAWLFGPGFGMPIAAFFLGVMFQRDRIRAVVAGERPDPRRFSRLLLWLLPVSLIGAATFLIPEIEPPPETHQGLFLLAMSAISVIVFAASRNVAAFLVETGLLFEGFYERVVDQLMPAFAFLTFYSMVVIVFACVYRIVDLATVEPQFAVDGTARLLTFAESLYFSIVSLSTVGYGDIVPATGLVRMIVALQLVAGILLLLFGFNEIFQYASERRHRRERRDGSE